MNARCMDGGPGDFFDVDRMISHRSVTARVSRVPDAVGVPEFRVSKALKVTSASDRIGRH